MVNAGVETRLKLTNPAIGVSPGGVENLDPRYVEYPFEVMNVLDAATGEAAGVLDHEHVEVVSFFLPLNQLRNVVTGTGQRARHATKHDLVHVHEPMVARKRFEHSTLVDDARIRLPPCTAKEQADVAFTL